MTDDSLQELSRLQAVAAALQERPEGEDEAEELYDYEEELGDDDEALLASMDEDSEFSEDYAEEVDTDILDDMEDGFDDTEETTDSIVLTDIDDTDILDDIDESFEETVETVTEEPNIEVQPIDTVLEDTDTIEIEESDDGFIDDDIYTEESDGFDDDDNFEESDDDFDENDGFEDDYYEEPIKKPTTSIPLTPPGATVLRPPVSAPIAPPTSRPPGSAPIAPPMSVPVKPIQTVSDEESLFDEMDDGFSDDEQDAYLEYVDDESDLDEEISEEIEIDEQYIDETINRGVNSANSFGKTEPEGENPVKSKNFDYADNDSYATAEIEDFIEEDEDGKGLDLSVLETVPLVETPVEKTDTTALEAENERLRRQLAELENEKLKRMLAEQTTPVNTQTQPVPPPIKLNVGVVVSQPEQTKQTSQHIKAETDKERAQRQRWAKYAAMSTQDLWRYVYQFMTMAGVQKAPVKAKILVDEFGSRNIKRLEATYIMATKDGYTC